MPATLWGARKGGRLGFKVGGIIEIEVARSARSGSRGALPSETGPAKGSGRLGIIHKRREKTMKRLLFAHVATVALLFTGAVRAADFTLGFEAPECGTTIKGTAG